MADGDKYGEVDEAVVPGTQYPGDASPLWIKDANDKEYIDSVNRSGDLTHRTHGGKNLSSLYVPQPFAHIYLRTLDVLQPSKYEDVQTTYAFGGVLGSADARIVETSALVFKPIEEVRALKLDELNDQYLEVRFSACDLTGNGGGDNWAFILDEQQRARFDSSSMFFFDRDGDIAGDSAAGNSDAGIIGALLSANRSDFATWAADLDAKLRAIKPRWPPAAGDPPRVRTVPMRLRHKANRSEITYNIDNIQDWGGRHKDVGIFDGLVDDAFLDAKQDIETETDVITLAAINVKEDYPWPPHWP